MSDRPDSFMPLWIGDYLADTTHLSTAEHGAYLLLIMAYWRAGKALPTSDTQLSRITKMSPEEWKVARKSVLLFFKRTQDGYFHARIEKELSKAKSVYDKRSQSGKLGNSKRWGSQTGSQNGRDGIARGSQSQSHLSKDKARARAGFKKDPATPAQMAQDWADEYPEWKAFKSSIHPTEWANWFANARPNGSTASLVAETPFQHAEVAARYLSRLQGHFGGKFALKLKDQKEQAE
jgi:uncharacterized protein YdaU (DUF1376 family)